MFSSKNIIWVKSVKRNEGAEWAYEELNCNIGETQKLHWRNEIGKTAASHPLIGDIILLFQTVTTGPHKNIVHLTHLVSPVSEDVCIDQTNLNFKWYREVQLIAKASPIFSIPKPDILKFGKVGNGGLTFSIDLLENNKINTLAVQDLIWDSFFDFFCPNITQVPVSFRSGFAGEPEGDLRSRNHVRQEYRWRNTRIVLEKKKQAIRNGGGRILCECCNFDFLGIYGEIGNGFIECHHKIFLNGGERITELDDLALVCSNCHRMLHQKKVDDTYCTIEELRTLIQSFRNKAGL